MGVDVESVEVLALARARGVDFGSTLTLGAQSWFLYADDLSATLRSFGDSCSVGDAQEVLRRNASRTPRRPEASAIFEYFGAETVDEMDMSDFEGASIEHDLNLAIPSDLHGRFSFVYDGGTLEHVFDVKTAIDNMMRLVAPGGHLMSVVPANNQMGHGFYQFAPELYFRTFCPDNGFETLYVFLKDRGIRSHWYLVRDPAEAGRRLTLSTAGETDMFLLARRVGDAGLAAVPFQSDYAVRWAQHSETGEGGAETAPTASGARALVNRLPISRDQRFRLMQAARQVKVRRGTIAMSPDLQRVELPELARSVRG